MFHWKEQHQNLCFIDINVMKKRLHTTKNPGVKQDYQTSWVAVTHCVLKLHIVIQRCAPQRKGFVSLYIPLI